MLAGEFSRLCKKLNSNIWFSFNNDNYYRNAGLYCGGEHICGVPANYVPEHTVFDEKGIIIDRGWRDIFPILLNRKVIKKKDLKKELKKKGYSWR